MEPFGEDDVIRVPRPRSLVRMLFAVLHLQTQRGISRDRGDTITAVTDVLSTSGRTGTIISRDRDSEWQISLGPTTPPGDPAAPELHP